MLQNLEQIVKTIWPFMILHAGVTAIIFSIMFYLLKRAQIFPSAAELKPLRAGVIIGLAISLFYSSDLMIKNAQSQAMSQAIAEQQQATNSANQANPLAQRADFLKAIDFLTNNPEQLTQQSKAKLYEQFSGLFPNGIGDVRAYYDQLKVAFTCQLSMYEDGLQTFKKKKVVRSEETAKCETLPGSFFNRERLIGPEMLQAHSLLKERILKPVPGDKALSEADLKLMIEQQKKKMATLERIFQ